jgi:hypothetical protein
MLATDIEPGPEGFERRSFTCPHCGRDEARMIACDPMEPDAVGWRPVTLRPTHATARTSGAGRSRDTPDA